MTSVFTVNPICINVVLVKHAHVSKKFVFIGTVPKSVEKELMKIQAEKKVRDSDVLQNFYGANWKVKLGVNYMAIGTGPQLEKKKNLPGRLGGLESDLITMEK